MSGVVPDPRRTHLDQVASVSNGDLRRRFIAWRQHGRDDIACIYGKEMHRRGLKDRLGRAIDVDGNPVPRKRKP